MMNYLTSDEVIRQNFLLEEILPRFVSMLLSVLTKLVGARSLDIKVDNTEAYNFDPKQMLREICSAILNFATFQAFVEALCVDGFFGDKGTVLKQTIATVTKLGLLANTELATLQDMYDKALTAKAMSQVTTITCMELCQYSYLYWTDRTWMPCWRKLRTNS
jgi:ubiquitin conjugation factor E4 B